MQKKQQLGRALSILARFKATEEMMHMDVSAFHAPSECHGLVSRGEEKRARFALRHARAVSGLNKREFAKAIRQGYRGAAFVDHAVSRILGRECPY